MMEQKLKHTEGELTKITNTKVFAKANSLIFELDCTLRQLRLIKDSVFSMEDNLKSKVKLAFEKDLT
jgi:hypothetical protein